MNLQPVKSRFGIVGNSPGLERALATAVRVAPADITVLVRGESGTGKEALPRSFTTTARGSTATTSP